MAISKISTAFMLMTVSATTAWGQAQGVQVQKGDTLSTIAAKVLGDAERWPELCDANRSSLKSCDLLDVGATLIVPGEPMAAPNSSATQELVKPTTANAAAGELIRNGDFSDGVSSWASYNSQLEASSEGMRITGGGKGAHAFQTSLNVIPGNTYLLTATVELIDAKSAAVRVTEGKMAQLGQAETTVSGSQTLSVSFVPNSDEANVLLRIPGEGTGSVMVKSISVKSTQN